MCWPSTPNRCTSACPRPPGTSAEPAPTTAAVIPGAAPDPSDRADRVERVTATGGLLGHYRELFTVPHLPGLLSWSLVARLHLACTSLVITFLVAGWTGSYAVAGLVIGALTV